MHVFVELCRFLGLLNMKVDELETDLITPNKNLAGIHIPLLMVSFLFVAVAHIA